MLASLKLKLVKLKREFIEPTGGKITGKGFLELQHLAKIINKSAK